MVKLLRQIREELSLEIQGMTFEEERAYLNRLLAAGTTGQPPSAKSPATGTGGC